MPTEDVNGYAFDVGVNYAFIKNLSGSLGYKHQILNYKYSDDNTFTGPTLSLDYRF